MVRGWVYVISNKAMPKLVKVGYSERDPLKRATELGSGTEVPFRYEVIYDALVYSPFEVEQHVHRTLIDLRTGKEWFECDWIAAVDAVRNAASNVSKVIIEKEYDILIEYRSQKARVERDSKEKEAKERALREQEARVSKARVESDQASRARDRYQAVAHTLDTTRIALCPKCHSTVKTSGKPPPYFCVGCGRNFISGV